MKPTRRILAALDVGTNSSLFLLAQLNEVGRIQPLLHDVRTNDLGRGLTKDGNLTDATIELNLKLLQEFQALAQNGQAQELRIAATEALRRAKNAGILIERAHKELGLDIQIISGEQEAALTYLGVVSEKPGEERKLLVMDVGGGSTEITLGQGTQLLHWDSLPLGAVSLDQAFIQHDPPWPEEIEQIRAHIRRTFTNLASPFRGEEAQLIICGGTASALASVALRLIEYQPDKLSGYRMDRSRLVTLISQFARVGLEQRRQIPGVGYRRAEIILPGTLIIDEFLSLTGRSSYMTSERGLRYGMLLSPQWPP